MNFGAVVIGRNDGERLRRPAATSGAAEAEYIARNACGDHRNRWNPRSQGPVQLQPLYEGGPIWPDHGGRPDVCQSRTD